MELEFDETEDCRPVSTNLVTSAVMAVMLLVLAAFLAQFPEVRTAEAEPVAAR